MAHAYRLKDSNGRKAYVTEPHSLNALAIGALAELAEKGWQVTVEAAGALFLPGQSLRIVIVCPVKAGVFNGSQPRQGKSQKPCSVR